MREGTILIVDDEAAQRGILELILKSERYITATAGSAEEPVSRYPAEAFDVVLTDL